MEGGVALNHEMIDGRRVTPFVHLVMFTWRWE